eukprot:NODE_775_length_3976_cov_0.534176.p1 type:complete len:165 gc:universal NODE_775_length_3976_cov_0.534176:1521-2015(+)
MTTPFPVDVVNPSSRGVYHTYDLKNKIKFLDEYHLVGKNTALSRKNFNLTHVPFNTIDYWIKTETQIRNTANSYTRRNGTRNRKRCAGGGRKLVLKEGEYDIYNQIIEMRDQKVRVTRKMVSRFALSYAEKNNITGFKATSKWLILFFKIQFVIKKIFHNTNIR